uniref:Glycoside hydrolase family 5 domain-containing protein n=1 Tax=Phytophthora ramorum TaxID=164328 RepID=H3H964_PHYRM
MDNGTSVYEIAAFLARNKFNSVRLPVCIKNILKDTAPDKSLINLNTNRAINITSYMTTIQTIVEALGYRHITVMISLHTLDPKKSGGAWYSEDLGVSEEDFLTAVDTLTKNLCTSKYWNILGLDLKNEPHECSWGGDDPDWQKGATLIGNRMLEGCPNWLAFVEGIASKGTITLNGEENTYFDWWGGGLADAGGDPVTFDVENKLVWAPHYYNTGVSPAWYLYASGTQNAEGALEDYVELDDDTLRNNVEKTMDKMFGYLLGVDTNTAMVMGEFAGLYGKDAHPLLTTKRTTDFTIEVMLQSGYAGGYMWSLNPESAYQYNPADTYGTFTEGLLEDDWITPNKVFVDGIAALDEIKNLKMFPCFEVEMTSAAGSSILAGILQFVEAAAVSLAVLTASKPLSMEVRIVRPMPPKSSDIPSETGDDADRPSSYRNTEYTSGRASAYAAGDGSDSGRETMMSSRQTEMKLMAMDLSDGLTNAGENPVELTTEHKVVWAPHYYNTGVYPAWYLYESTGAVTASGAYESFVELGDDDLRYNVEKTMDKMFGYLAGSSDYAMVMGEFAGLYSKDVHPMKTTKRTTDYTIEVMVKAGYAGGYMWSLNPESAYQYNPATVYGTFTEGLLEDDWITPNKVFMEGMAAMEKIKNLKRFPCFPQKASSSGSS